MAKQINLEDDPIGSAIDMLVAQHNKTFQAIAALRRIQGDVDSVKSLGVLRPTRADKGVPRGPYRPRVAQLLPRPPLVAKPSRRFRRATARMQPGKESARVLAVLEDGRQHTLRDIVITAGFATPQELGDRSIQGRRTARVASILSRLIPRKYVLRVGHGLYQATYKGLRSSEALRSRLEEQGGSEDGQ